MSAIFSAKVPLKLVLKLTASYTVKLLVNSLCAVIFSKDRSGNHQFKKVLKILITRSVSEKICYLFSIKDFFSLLVWQTCQIFVLILTVCDGIIRKWIKVEWFLHLTNALNLGFFMFSGSWKGYLHQFWFLRSSFLICFYYGSLW